MSEEEGEQLPPTEWAAAWEIVEKLNLLSSNELFQFCDAHEMGEAIVSLLKAYYGKRESAPKTVEELVHAIVNHDCILHVLHPLLHAGLENPIKMLPSIRFIKA
jgi:hypothetical protein